MTSSSGDAAGVSGPGSPTTSTGTSSKPQWQKLSPLEFQWLLDLTSGITPATRHPRPHPPPPSPLLHHVSLLDLLQSVSTLPMIFCTLFTTQIEGSCNVCSPFLLFNGLLVCIQVSLGSSLSILLITFEFLVETEFVCLQLSIH